MTKEEALDFLAAHQPLPDDGGLEDELVDRYDEIRKFFLEAPEPRSVKLFLGSFGDGSGFGVYQLISDVVERHPPEVVIPALEEAIASPHPGVRYWSTQIVPQFPDERLVRPLLQNLSDERADIRTVTADALGAIASRESLAALRARADVEEDVQVRDALREAILAIEG